MTTPTAARAERFELCDLFLAVGPDAPTLCGDWTTRDLAAHLVMRERRPDGAAGVLIGPLSAYADKVQTSIAERDWEDLVETVRTGPPVWSPTRVPAVDRIANTAEFFVHHEDVRRAEGVWDERTLSAELTDDLAGALSRMSRLLVRKSEVGLVLRPDDGREAIVAKKAEQSVDATGSIGELVLFVFGRQDHCDVELQGTADDIETISNASFGI